MRKIQTAANKPVVIDNADYKLVKNKTWHITSDGYARHNFRVGKKMHGILMHTLIIGAPKGACVDHIDGDKLNNRRSNLRLCSIKHNNILGAKRRAAATYECELCKLPVEYMQSSYIYGPSFGTIKLCEKCANIALFNLFETKTAAPICR